MAQKSRRKKRKLKSLPASDDEYFTKVDADTEQIKERPGKECKHYFERTTGREVECKYCNIGYILGVKARLKDGHIYIDGKLVI